MNSVDLSSASGINLEQYLQFGGLHSDKTHLNTLTATIMRNRRSEKPTATQGTANSLRNAMLVFKKQQQVLQDNAKAVIEQQELDVSSKVELRTRQMTQVYGVKNPRSLFTNQESRKQFASRFGGEGQKIVSPVKVDLRSSNTQEAARSAERMVAGVQSA